MKVLIAGATGFVGKAIASRLKERHEISGLARSEASAEKLRKLGLSVVLSDLLAVQAEQLSGFEVVIHCAAYVEEWGTEKDFYDNNVVGTRNLLESAKRSGVKRFIFIGTEAAFFVGNDLVNIDETIPYPKWSPYLYSRTKAQAEHLVLTAGNSKFVTLSLRPRFVWGPGDQTVLPTLIEKIRKGQFAWINQGHFLISTTYIENLTHAAEQALSFGSSGEAFFIADDGVVDMREFLTEALKAKGVVAPARSLPKFVVRPLARMAEFSWKTFGLKSEPPLVRFSVDMMSTNCTVNTAKAKRILNYQPPVSREEGLALMARID